MDVRCESCGAQYKVDDAKIPDQGIKAKCPKCGHSFFLKKPDAFAPPVPDDGAIPIGGDAVAPPPPAPDPFGGAPAGDPFGAAPGGDPFGAAPPPGATDGGFPGAFGGAPDLSGFGGASPEPGAPAPPADAPAPPDAPPPAAPAFGSGEFGGSAPTEDPFGPGGVFGGGALGGGAFEAPAAPQDGLGGLFQAKTAFEIQRANGQQVGPFDMITLKQMIYEQQLDGTEQLNDATGTWVPITSIEELGEIFRLTGAGGMSGAPDAGAWGAAPPADAGWAPQAPSGAPAPPATPASDPFASSPPAEPASVPGSQPPPATAFKPASVAAPPPPPPVKLEAAGGKRSVGEKFLIFIETVWAFGKNKTVRIVGGTLAAITVLGVVGFIFRAPIMSSLGLDKRLEASKLIDEGDRTLASGERGPLLGALANYEAAVQRYPEGAEGLARLAEAQAILWARDPERLDMKAAAETNLGRAREFSASSPAVLRAAARVALASGDADAAIAAVEAARAASASGDPLLSVILGEAALLKKDLAAAEAAFTQAASGPTAGQAQTGLARVKLAGGDLEAAKAAAQAAATAEPDNGYARALLAFTTARTGGDVDAAKKTLHEVRDARERFARTRARAAHFLGLLALEEGKRIPALGLMRHAIRLDPGATDTADSARALFAARFPDRSADEWLAGIATVRGSKAMAKIRQGEAKYAVRDWQGALAPLQDAVTEDPGSVRARYALGMLLVDVGGQETAKAKAHFEKALELDPKYADAAVALSRWELASGNSEAANSAAEKAIAADPTLPSAYRAAAAAAVGLKDPEKAERYLLEATAMEPENHLAWLELGEAQRLAKRPDDALNALEKAADLRPDLAQPQIGLGEAWEAKRDYAKALEYFKAAAAIDPGSPEIATRVGVVLVKKGMFKEGRSKLESVVKSNPQIAEAQYQLGVAHQFTGDPSKAIEDYRAAIKHKYYEEHMAHFHLGEIYASSGGTRDVDLAKEHLGRVLELKPDYYQAYEELSKLYQSERDFPAALDALKSVGMVVARLPRADSAPVLERVLLQQGKIAKDQGKPKNAEPYFRRVLQINPRSAEALWNLGELSKDTSPAKARTYFLKATQANKDYAPPYKSLFYMLKDGNCRQAKTYGDRFVELTGPSAPEEAKEIEDLMGYMSC